MNLYLLARRLPKHEFVATGAWFFFVVNLLKLPIYAFHGLIHRLFLLLVRLIRRWRRRWSSARCWAARCCTGFRRRRSTGWSWR